MRERCGAPAFLGLHFPVRNVCCGVVSYHYGLVPRRPYISTRTAKLDR